MGEDIHIKVVKFNHEDRYFHELKLFRMDKEGNYVPACIYNGRNYEMFSAMKNGEENNYGIFPYRTLRYSSLVPELQEELLKFKNEIGNYDFSEILLSEFANYIKDHKEILDYDADWGEDDKNIKYKENPLCALYRIIYDYIDFSEQYGIDWDFTDYKVIYWFDR